MRNFEKDWWETKDHKRIKICDMETSHIKNTISYLEKHRDFYDSWGGWDSESFYYDDNSYLVDWKIEELEYELSKRERNDDLLKSRIN